jgi:ketosteroid isomerase-like protein
MNVTAAAASIRAVLCLLALLGSRHAIADDTADVAALRELETTRQAAIKARDFDALRRIYAEDFVGIAGNGRVISRADLMDVFAHNDGSLAFTTDEVDVRVYGDTAIFTGRLTARMASGEVASAGRFTHVFVRRAGAWVCVHGQSTPIAQ